LVTPSLFTYGLMLLTEYYAFAMIGMEIFGDSIQTQEFVNNQSYNCYNYKLDGTEFAK
jgi:hypothetical protein